MLFFMCTCVDLGVCMCTAYRRMPVETGRGHQILWTTYCGCWEPDPGSLQGQQPLSLLSIPAVPSFCVCAGEPNSGPHALYPLTSLQPRGFLFPHTLASVCCSPFLDNHSDRVKVGAQCSFHLNALDI